MSVAIFGLLPVPPMPDTLSSSSYNRRKTSEDRDFSQLVILAHSLAERMKPRRVTKGSRHNPAGAPAASSSASVFV